MVKSGVKAVGGLLIGSLAVKCISIIIFDDEAIADTRKYWNKYIRKFTKQPSDELVVKKRVVVLGSGWAALSFIQQLDRDIVDVTVISPRAFFFYTPLLAGTATGTVSASSIIEPIRWYCPAPIAHIANSASTSSDNASVEKKRKINNGNFGLPQNFINAECTSVDVVHKTVTCSETRTVTDSNAAIQDGDMSSSRSITLRYDFLVVAVGAEPATFNIPGVREYALFMKEIEDGIRVKQRILKQLEHANYLMSANRPKNEIQASLRWFVVGGGPTGVELTAELNDFIIDDVSKHYPHLVPFMSVTLLEGTGRILGMLDAKTAEYAHKVLETGGRQSGGVTKGYSGASVAVNALVSSITDSHITYKLRGAGTIISSDSVEQSIVTVPYGLVVWAGGVASRPITKSIAAQIQGQDSRFGLKVDDWLRVVGVGDHSIFALGDCAVIPSCAPTAQAASQQGKFLRRLLRDTAFDEDLVVKHTGFRYVNYGALAYVGNSRGVAELKPMWELPPFTENSSGSSGERTFLSGTSAFAIWRSLYFSKLMSWKNQAQVAFDWCKVSLFGRDIVTPSGISYEDANKK